MLDTYSPGFSSLDMALHNQLNYPGPIQACSTDFSAPFLYCSHVVPIVIWRSFLTIFEFKARVVVMPRNSILVYNSNSLPCKSMSEVLGVYQSVTIR